MAKRTIHVLVDDIDGGDADETVTFALDGIQYEIDLSTKHAKELRSKLERYVAAGTKIGRGTVQPPAGRRGARRTGASSASTADQNRAIREWAQAKGLPVSDRGRIKQDVVDQFHAEAGR